MKVKKSQLKRTIFKIFTEILESRASEKAKQMGLKHVGWGKYSDKQGKVVAKSVKGDLIMLDKKQKSLSKPSDIEGFKNRPDIYYSKLTDINEEKKRFFNSFSDDKFHFKYDRRKIKKSIELPHGNSEIVNRDDAVNVEDIGFDIIREVNKNGTLAGDEVELLARFTRDFAKTSVGSGFTINTGRKLIYDSLNKILYQEFESRKRQLGDHGIRHVVKNAQYTNKILEEFNKVTLNKSSNRKRILAMIVQMNHDIGYATKFVRDKNLVIEAPKAHPRISVKWMQNDFKKNKIYDNLSIKEKRWVLNAILTHDGEELNWDKPEVSAIRLADNMSVFQEDKLPMLFKEMPDSKKVLENIHKACKEKDDKTVQSSKKKLMTWVKEAKHLKSILKPALMHAAREVNCFTAKATLGMWAGEISDIKFDKSKEKIFAEIEVKHNKYDKYLQDAGFNLGQDKYRKFLNSFGIKDIKSEDVIEAKNKLGDTVLMTKLVQ